MSEVETTETVEAEVETVEEETAGETQADEFEQYPDDHPLVKTLAKQKAELKELRKQFGATKGELDEVRKQSMTEQERAIESVKEETARSVRIEFAQKLVDAELKAQLNGRTLEGGAVLTFDKAAFVDDSGDIDVDAIQAWVEAHSTRQEAPKPDLGQGTRGRVAQIKSREELASMSHQEILAARQDGRLDSLLGKL
jgi:TolA-binding protein